jgi:hypothetical protein
MSWNVLPVDTGAHLHFGNSLPVDTSQYARRYKLSATPQRDPGTDTVQKLYAILCSSYKSAVTTATYIPKNKVKKSPGIM